MESTDYARPLLVGLAETGIPCNVGTGMQLNFAPLRLFLFASCLGIFAALGGFAQPDLGEDVNSMIRGRVMRAWFQNIALFVLGAGCVALVDHEVGTIDRTSLRPAYIVAGLGLMIAVTVWQLSLQTAVEKRPRHSSVGRREVIAERGPLLWALRKISTAAAS